MRPSDDASASNPPDPAPPTGQGQDRQKRSSGEPVAESHHESAGVGDDGLHAAVAALTTIDIEPAERRRLMSRVVREVRRTGLAQFFQPRAALRWLADTVRDVAPHIPIRDSQTLRRHHDGEDDDALAARLIRNAALATAGVGAAGGGVASLEWLATPTLLSAPVLLAAETVAVAAIELKLVGELHEVYRQPMIGGPAQRGASLVHAWATQRGVNPLVPGVGIGAVLGTAARKELQSTVLRRFGRNLTTLGPLLSGAAVASYLNQRATKSMGERLQKDLRRNRPPIEGVVHQQQSLPGP